MSTSAPDVSVIVCTKNRADRLQNALGYLNRNATKRPWELVIVDNGSRDSTSEVIRRFRDETTVTVRYVYEPRAGLAKARNAGWRAASGRILAFTDDDCYPRSDYVDTLGDLFAARPDLGYMGGRVLLHDPTDAPVTIREENEPVLLGPYSFPQPGLIHGANMAFRSEVLRELGGFDECLGVGTPVGSGEDIELCGRAANSGWAGGYFPAPTVRHHHGRKPGSDTIRLGKRYDRGRGAYYAKTLLRCSKLRSACLKSWYWQTRAVPWSTTTREIAGAMQYFSCAVVTKVKDYAKRQAGLLQL